MNIETIKNKVMCNETLQQKLKTDFVSKDMQTGKLSCCTSASIPEDSVEYYQDNLPELLFYYPIQSNDEFVSVELTQESIRIIEKLLECSILK
jgi:hypothetical protein